jgi:integrase/recombinase XerC
MKNSLVTTQAGAIQSAEKTFDDVVTEWFNSDSMFRVREQSKRSYRKSLKAFQAWLVAQGIMQPCKQDVKNWCAAMDAEGLSVATKNLRLTTLRNFCKWLSSEYGTPNIADVKGWKETKEHRRGFLSCEEMKALLKVVETDTLRGKRDKAILGVLLTGGLRTCEISRLKISDVIHKGGVTYLNVIGKGRDTGELVKISRKAEQLIREWQIAREAADVVSDSSPLFISLGNNSFGEPLSSNSVSTLCKRYLEAAGLKTPQIVAHSLRHSLATNSLIKGASLMEVQQQLRHVNLSTTQIYLHEAEKAKNRCTDLISDEIF